MSISLRKLIRVKKTNKQNQQQMGKNKEQVQEDNNQKKRKNYLQIVKSNQHSKQQIFQLSKEIKKTQLQLGMKEIFTIIFRRILFIVVIQQLFQVNWKRSCSHIYSLVQLMFFIYIYILQQDNYILRQNSNKQFLVYIREIKKANNIRALHFQFDIYLLNGSHSQQSCDEDEQPVALRDSCRILFSDHNVQCSQDSDPNRRNGPRVINGKNLQGCNGGHYVIKHHGQQLNNNMNQIILDKQLFPIPAYTPQISNAQHCQEFFQNAAHVYSEDCDILQNENIYIQSKDDFSFIDIMSDQQFPFHSSTSGNYSGHTSSSSSNSDQRKDTQNTDKLNSNTLQFNRLFNPWNQVISEDILTLVETQGEIKIYNHSPISDYVIQIFEINQDTNIITIDKKQEDIQPNKERSIKFSVIPEEVGENQEINLYFKIRIYDTRLLKPVSSKTVQYTITLARVRKNKFRVKPINLGKIQAGQMAHHQLTLFNPDSQDLYIKEMMFLKKYVYLTDNIENFAQGEKNHNLQQKNINQKDIWNLQSKKETKVINFIIYQNQTGTFIDYLRIYFENSSLIIQIPVRLRVVTNSLSFQTPYFHMGIISSHQGYNSRTIIVDNNSPSTIEIKDIIVHFKNYYSCMVVEAVFDQSEEQNQKQTQSEVPKPYQVFSKLGCLNQNKRLIIKPYEENRKIGILKIFPKILDANSQQKIFEGRIQLITNSTSNDIEQEIKFYLYEQIMSYTQSLTQFKVASNPDDTVNTQKIIPSTPVPSEYRKFELTNGFSSQVKVTKLKKPPTTETFNFNNHIEIINLKQSIIEVGEKKQIFEFRLIGNSTKLDTYILLEFNKNFVVPIYFKVYNMHLLCAINFLSDYYDCSELSQHELIKFGNKAINKTAIQEFRIKNDNPEVITIYSVSKLQSPINIILKKHINYLGNIQASNRVIVDTSKKYPLMYIGPFDEAIFTIELNTQSVVRSYNNVIQTYTNYEQFSYLMEFNVVSGDTELNPLKIHFKRSLNAHDQLQSIEIKNTYDVNLKVIDFEISDPRFQILNFTRTIPAKSTKQLFTLVFNSTYGYGSNIKPYNDDNFISIEDMIMWNITQSMIENSEKNILSADVIINFDIKSIFISATAEVQQLRLIKDSVINFNNTETNQFYSKSLTFINTLDIPISFQLYIAPQNISSQEIYLNKQTQFQQEIEFIFCVPNYLYQDPLIKEIYDNLSNFFTNKGMETSTEVQNLEVLKKIQSLPDFDKSQEKNLLSISEAIKQFQIFYDESSNSQNSSSDVNGNKVQNQHSNQKNGNGNDSSENNQNDVYTCKEGLMTQKIKNYLIKIEFIKQLVEFYRDPQKNIQKIQEQILQVQSMKREILEITQTTRNRPCLYNYSVKVEKGLWEKIKHFFTSVFFSSSGSLQDHTITDWQSQQYNFGDWPSQSNNGSPNKQSSQKQNDILNSQQFFLSSEVLNKTIVLQPKQQIDINSLIYMPKYGEAYNNLIIKSNASVIDIIPIRGKSGVGRIKLMDVKNMSPILFSQLQNQKNKSIEEVQYRSFIQGYINNDVFIYSLTQEELEGAQKHNVDSMKNFIIKNVGQYPISIKNIYIESQPCAAYGFFILGCSCQFKLDPQQEKTITIGYKTEYPYDTLEKNIYFYTQTYHIKFKIRAQFYHRSSPYPLSTVISQQISPSVLQDKKISDSIIEAFNLQGGNLFSGESFERELQNGNSEKMFLAILENIEKATSAAQDILLSSDDDETNAQQDINPTEWSWMTDKMSQYILKNPQITVKDNINPYFNYFILSIIFMTALFFIYTFVSFIYQDVLSLNSKKSKYESYTIRNSQINTSNQIIGPQSPNDKLSKANPSNNNNNKPKRNQNKSNNNDAENDYHNYDISEFIKNNKLDSSIQNLKAELQKIKEFQEKQQMELRLQKQKQIQLHKNKERANEGMKPNSPQQFGINEKDMQREYFENNSDKDDDDIQNEEEEYENRSSQNIHHETSKNQQYNQHSIEQSHSNLINQSGYEQFKDNLIAQEDNQLKKNEINQEQSNQVQQSQKSIISVNTKKTQKERSKKQSKRDKDRIVVVSKEAEPRSKKNSEETPENQNQPKIPKKKEQYDQQNSEQEYEDEDQIVRKDSNLSSSSAATSNTGQNTPQAQHDNKKTPQLSFQTSRTKDESIQREIEQAILKQQQQQKIKEEKIKEQYQQSYQQSSSNNGQKYGQYNTINQNQTNLKNNYNGSNNNQQSDIKNVFSKKQQNYSETQAQQSVSQKALYEELQNGGQKRKKSENFIVDDFHLANEFQAAGGANSYSLSQQQQQMQKKAFLIHDHISSCGEDDDNNVSSSSQSNIRKKKASKASQDINQQFPVIEQFAEMNKGQLPLSMIPKSNLEERTQNQDSDKNKNQSGNQSFYRGQKKEDFIKKTSPIKDLDFNDNPLLQKLTASYLNNHLISQNQTSQFINQSNNKDIKVIDNKVDMKEDEDETFEDNNNKSNEQNAQSSDGSQLSSGDSLSEEDIDNFKRSNEQIKAIGFTRFGQFQNSFIGNDDENNSTHSNNNNNNNSNSLRNSQNISRNNPNQQSQQSCNSIPSQGNLGPASKDSMKGSFSSNYSGINNQSKYQNVLNQNDINRQYYYNYQSESSDDDGSQPLTSINQRRYFNVFNSQPCFYPINLIGQNSTVDMTSSNDYQTGVESSFNSESAPTQQLSLGLIHNRTSSNQFSPSQTQVFQPPVIQNNSQNNRNFHNTLGGTLTGSQTLIDSSTPQNIHHYGAVAFSTSLNQNSFMNVQNQKFTSSQQLFVNPQEKKDSEVEFISDDQSQAILNSQQITLTSNLSDPNKIDQTSRNSQIPTSQRTPTSFNLSHMAARNPYPQSGSTNKKMNTKQPQNDLEENTLGGVQSTINQQQQNFQKQFISQQVIGGLKQTHLNAQTLKIPPIGPPPGMGMVVDNSKNNKNSTTTNEFKFDVLSAPPGLLQQSSKTSQ